jgi:hypothetical protein
MIFDVIERVQYDPVFAVRHGVGLKARVFILLGLIAENFKSDGFLSLVHGLQPLGCLPFLTFQQPKQFGSPCRPLVAIGMTCLGESEPGQQPLHVKVITCCRREDIFAFHLTEQFSYQPGGNTTSLEFLSGDGPTQFGVKLAAQVFDTRFPKDLVLVTFVRGFQSGYGHQAWPKVVKTKQFGTTNSRLQA